MTRTKRALLTSLLIPACIATGLALTARPLRAEILVLEIDPLASKVEFGFGATLHSVEGDLQLQGGSIRFDTLTGLASGQVDVAATTAKTGVKARDRKMHEKILESSTYPTISYKIERIDGQLNRSGRNDLQLHGQLTLHGVTLPAAIIAEAHVNGDQVHATGRFVVPYLTYGMADPSVFLLRVEKEVKITLSIAGHLVHDSPGMTASRPHNEQ
jgi:polyisoprenoid-binding protein YceI